MYTLAVLIAKMNNKWVICVMVDFPAWYMSQYGPEVLSSLLGVDPNNYILFRGTVFF